MMLPASSSTTFSSDFEIAYNFTVHIRKRRVLITQRKEISAPNKSDKEIKRKSDTVRRKSMKQPLDYRDEM